MKPEAYWLSQAEFERVIEDALDELPPRYAALVKNVAILAEDEPGNDDLETFDDDDDSGDAELLGIYRGVALTERSFDTTPLLPDEIAIFRGPICRVTDSREEAIYEIRETLIHELGHYFGLDEHELP